jgi:hypothetical protein
MEHRFFISHCGIDKNIAKLFSDALRRITLDQISPWFSSDDNMNGGLKPGDIWFNQIFDRITQSKAVVSLLTPNSINRPWVYFESGIGQALKNCEVIPVCIGVKRDDILPPLGLYQCYQLTDYRSVVEFFSKFLHLFEIKFDEELAKAFIEKFVLDISKINFDTELSEKEGKEKIKEIIENIKNHIDKRFLEIKDIQQVNIPMEVGYSVSFDIDFPEFKNKNLYIDIRQDDTFQNITNRLYFMLKEIVPVYTYLETWIIIEENTGKHVVIREIADKIPAEIIFRPNTKWKIVKLDKPYNGSDSHNRMIKAY